MGHQKLFPSEVGVCFHLEIFKGFQLQSSGQKCFLISLLLESKDMDKIVPGVAISSQSVLLEHWVSIFSVPFRKLFLAIIQKLQV